MESDPSLRSRKRIRLVAESYAQTANVCSVTVAVKARRPVFVKAELAIAALETLRHLADEHDVPVYAYCIMPDHVHMVLSPSNTCDIITFVGRFKNLVLRKKWAASGKEASGTISCEMTRTCNNWSPMFSRIRSGPDWSKNGRSTLTQARWHISRSSMSERRAPVAAHVRLASLSSFTWMATGCALDGRGRGQATAPTSAAYPG